MPKGRAIPGFVLFGDFIYSLRRLDKVFKWGFYREFLCFLGFLGFLIGILYYSFKA